MKTVLVTGAAGFIGRNLVPGLRRQPGMRVLEFDLQVPREQLPALVAQADLVFHLAGVNRPRHESEFTDGNVHFTEQLVELLASTSRPRLVLASSIQAESDNPYGRSKRAAEACVIGYHRNTGAAIRIYRFPNVFGKWSRPHYNTVVATFCHQISRQLPVEIRDRNHSVRFVYIDDVVTELLQLVSDAGWAATQNVAEVSPVYTLTLGELHDRLLSFRTAHEQGILPDLSSTLTRHLYSTYMAFRDPQTLARPVQLRSDNRGWLFEFIKSSSAGQIFVSVTRPGVTRGNHYHDSKVEKFCVVQGRGIIRLRPAAGGDVIEFPVDDRNICVVDIPPGTTHSIENTGDGDMLTLFWANEIFDPGRPDTYPAPVLDIPPPKP